jgi:broad specificity phosphatase PhoE
VGLTIYFVRHAEAANPRDILYGRLPRVDLSANGRKQAEALAVAMADLPLEAIYQSPLLRARRTAAAIAVHHPGVPIIRSSLLLENRHPFEGRPQTEVAKLADRAYDPDILGTTGESLLDLRDRVVRFLQRTSRRHLGGVVAAVAHADPLAVLRVCLLSKELSLARLREETPPLAAVFRVDFDDDRPPRLEWFWKAQATAPTNEGAASGRNGRAAVAESQPGLAVDEQAAHDASRAAVG